MKRIAVLGSTGSIGENCLKVINAFAGEMQAWGLSAHSRSARLFEQTNTFQPQIAVLSDEQQRDALSTVDVPEGTELRFGPEALVELASDPSVDVVVSAIVGAAGLPSTWAAIEAGKTVAIANKETLVVAGPLMTSKAEETGATLLPVDSEHNAIFQAMRAGEHREVKQIILTASGGPFRGWSKQQLQSVTPEMALKHPTWEMGPKITVDSATMMNKALEVIEAKWLFHLQPEQIKVVVHPQSIIHSFVEFVDGSVIAQLSPPDMKLPIQYALTFPDRKAGLSPTLDWSQMQTLEWAPPDFENFPALQLGFEVAARGGTCGAVLNAANEVAVERFLAGDLSFDDIPRACRAVLEAHEFEEHPTLKTLAAVDSRTREEIRQWRS